MQDEFQKHFWWIADWLKRPVSDFFEVDSIEHTILTHFKNGWGTRDTVELLRELTAEYGDAAGRAVEKYVELNILKDWAEIGKKEAHEGTEIEDLIRVLWDPLKEQGLEFTMKRENDTATFCVTRCPIHELAEKTGMHEWLYHLSCSADFHTSRAFSTKIGFTRTKTLIQGYECCNHHYYYLK
jgi:predicted ArsR family transcriptional regulator